MTGSPLGRIDPQLKVQVRMKQISTPFSKVDTATKAHVLDPFFAEEERENYQKDKERDQVIRRNQINRNKMETMFVERKEGLLMKPCLS
jgi:Tfp pilus assembly ATPase PilU